MSSIVYLLTIGMFSTFFIAFYIMGVIRIHDLAKWLKSFYSDNKIFNEVELKKMIIFKIIDVCYIAVVMISGIGLLKLLIKNVEFFTKIFYG